MAATRATAAHASVVFLRIPEIAQAPVAEQVRLKDRLEGTVATALAGLDEARRIVLEASDGAAVVVLGDPVAALRFARRAAAGEGLRVAAGISQGPVRVAEGSAAAVVLGDGIAVARAVADFAPPGRIAATREFRDALVRAASTHAWYLAPAGTHSDARDRSYEVFLADEATATARRRNVLLGIGAAVVAIVGLGIAARMGLEGARQVPPAPAARAKPGEPVRPAEPAKQAPAPVPAFATLRLEIKPAGEVLVDGAVKGRSPPLVSLQVAPGKHRIEIRRAGSSTLALHVDAGPGEELMIRHTFALPPPKSAWRRFFDQFK